MRYAWYIGYILQIDDDGKYEIDHLEHLLKSSNKKWKYPWRSDIHTAEECQVFSIEIKGVWEYESRYNRFILVNVTEISYNFTKIVSYWMECSTVCYGLFLLTYYTFRAIVCKLLVQGI